MKRLKNFINTFFVIQFVFFATSFAQDVQAPSQATQAIEIAPEKIPPNQDEISSPDPLFGPEAEPITYRGAFIKMILTLVGLILLIVLSVWILKRLSHGRMKQLNYGRSIKIIERRPLSAKSVLYLVEIKGKQVAIAESQVEIRPITPLAFSLDEDLSAD